MPFPKNVNREMKEYVKESGSDSIKIPSYRKLNNQVLKNFYGKTGKQYLLKTEIIKCN